MKQKLVIEVETTEKEQEPEDAVADIDTFAEALADGSLVKCAVRTDADGNGYPELGHLRIKIVHKLEVKESDIGIEDGKGQEQEDK